MERPEGLQICFALFAQAIIFQENKIGEPFNFPGKAEEIWEHISIAVVHGGACAAWEIAKS